MGGGGCSTIFGISRGEGGYCVLAKMENPRGGGGSYMIFPPWWGYGYFLELHNKYKTAM